MIIRIIKIITLSFVGFVLAMNALLVNAQVTENKLYKWQDNDGKWYYSKTPPDTASQLPKKLEVANDTSTIIFKKQATAVDNQELAAAEQQARQKRSNCQSILFDLRDIAFYLRKTTDKNFQEKAISVEEYNRIKKLITKLEDTVSDANFDDICVDDFSNEPQTKVISNCITEHTTLEDRGNCLKELPTI